jgi:indoleamine 2,3-dioxygenase
MKAMTADPMRDSLSLAMRLAEFDVDQNRGFLPSPDPLDRLPGDFSPWEEIAHDLPKLLVTENVRKVLNTMPLLDACRLGNERELKRAMVVLSFLGHAYVWGEKETVTSIPACLAVPWHQVARQLGRPPVLSYASYALDNWQRVVPEGPIELGNIVMMQNFLGGQDEEWFVLVHVAIEAKAGAALAGALVAQQEIIKDNPQGVADQLAIIARTLVEINKVLLRMPERCDPYIYFHRVRPYIHGWANQPSLPQGMRYEGVIEYGDQPQFFRGETGAQSSIIPAMDAVLGIAHAEDMLRSYLLEMRDYMPPRHRKFIEILEAGPSLRDYTLRHGGAHPLLKDIYNAALDGIERFRSIHLEYADRYIIRQSRGGKKNPTDVGTGGTPFGPYLRKHRDETKKHKFQ